MTVATAPMTVPARPPRADRSTPSARNRPAIVTVMTPEPSQVSETSPPPQGFNLTVVPVLIGFSLATIVLVATGPHPLPPASKVAICFLIVSVGLLLASFQLSIGRLRTYADEKTEGKNQRKHPWLDWLRTILSALGAA